MDRTTTLWSSAAPDQRLFEYTTGDDRAWDVRLLTWDVLGSLGHIEGLRSARLITPSEYSEMRRGLREVFVATLEAR
jgi:argininosuccinate lyase